MTRRIAASVSRDWSFGFVTRSAVSLSHPLYAYARKDGTHTEEHFTPQSLQTVAVGIAKALWGKYKDAQGQHTNAGGNMTKCCYVPGLSHAA